MVVARVVAARVGVATEREAKVAGVTEVAALEAASKVAVARCRGR